MRFSKQNLIFGVTSLLSLVGLGHTASCTDGPFASQTFAGKSGTVTNWCSTNWDKGLVVVGLELWATPWQVKGLRFSFSDGTKSDVYGQHTDSDGNELPTDATATWGEGDTIKSLSIGPNWVSPPDALGIFHLEASNGAKIDYAGTYTGKAKPVDVGSGIMLGGSGGSGAWIDGAQFMFLANTVGNAEISAIHFDEDLDTWNKKQQGIEAVDIGDVWFKNSNTNGTANKTYTFSSTDTKTTSKTLTQQDSHTLGAKVTTTVGVEVEVPFVTKASASVSYEASYQYQHMSSTTTTDTGAHALTYGETSTIAPGRAVHCRATTQRGSYSSGYDSTVTVTLAGGQKFNIKQRGQFDSIGWTDAVQNCVDCPLSQAPKDAVEADSKTSKPRTIRRSFKA